MDADHREGNALSVIATHEAPIVFVYGTQITALPQLKASTDVVELRLADNSGGVELATEDGPVAAVRPVDFLGFSVELEEECLGQPGSDELVGHRVRKIPERIKGVDVVELRSLSGNLPVQSVYTPFDVGGHSVQGVLPPTPTIDGRRVEKRLEGAVDESVAQPATARLRCHGCFADSIASPDTDDEVRLFAGGPDDLALSKGGAEGTVGSDAAVLEGADPGEILGREIPVSISLSDIWCKRMRTLRRPRCISS
jgi:hypothetical protein